MKSVLWTNPTGGLIRVDAAGDGHYGKRRDGGKRLHRGIDLLCYPGEKILAPFEGLVERDGFVYSDTKQWKLVVLVKEDIELKLMYVEPFELTLVATVKEATPIGFAQDIRGRYPGVKSHIHVELRKNGVVIDPTPFFFA